ATAAGSRPASPSGPWAPAPRRLRRPTKPRASTDQRIRSGGRSDAAAVFVCGAVWGPSPLVGEGGLRSRSDVGFLCISAAFDGRCRAHGERDPTSVSLRPTPPPTRGGGPSASIL